MSVQKALGYFTFVRRKQMPFLTGFRKRSSVATAPSFSASRILWLDLARGYMILMMFCCHSIKGFSGTAVSTLGRTSLSPYFLRFTFGFVGVTGVGLMLLSDRISAKASLPKYCLKRGLRLYLVALAIGLLFRSHYSNLKFDAGFSVFFESLATVLFVGKKWVSEKFLGYIALFVMLAGWILPGKGKFPWVALYTVLLMIILLSSSLPYNPYVTYYWKESASQAGTYFLSGSLGVLIGWVLKKWRLWEQGSVALYFFLFLFTIVAVTKQSWIFGPVSRNSLSLAVDCFFRIVSVVSIAICLSRIQGLNPAKATLSVLGTFALMIYEMHWAGGKTYSRIVGQMNFLKDPGMIQAGLIVCTCILFLIGWSYVVVRIRLSLPKLHLALREELGF